MAPADTMVLFRCAMKQVARRHGHLVSFMCRPKFPNAFSSGWHLHQSLLDRKTGAQRVRLERQAQLLSPLGRALSRRAARQRARGGGVRHADAQRLQALSRRQHHGADPGDLGARQSRRDGARDGPSRRSGDASGEPRRRAAGQSVSLHGVADPRRARRRGAQARPRAVGRRAVRELAAEPLPKRSPRRSTRSTPTPVSAPLSATPSSTITSRSSASRSRAPAEGGGAADATDVTAWEHREYFDLACDPRALREAAADPKSGSPRARRGSTGALCRCRNTDFFGASEAPFRGPRKLSLFGSSHGAK